MKRKNYVAYLRQSTMKQEISGLGVEAQREIIRNYLKDRKTVSNRPSPFISCLAIFYLCPHNQSLNYETKEFNFRCL